jgi:ABC-type branched-subunit amino acid transport system permease subunit
MSFLHYWRFVFGAILAFIVIVTPEGIAGVISTKIREQFGKA